MTRRTDALGPARSDDLPVPQVKEYARSKYALLYDYASIFSTSMKDSWDHRVYIDLFAGAGKARIEGTRSVLLSSPLLALSVPHRFTRYVFCEKTPERLDALKRRVAALDGEADCRFLGGDVNEQAERILSELPKYSRDSRVLSFCFVDPYRMADLRFETIEAMSTLWVDFLILIPTGMEFNRWCGQHFWSNSGVVADFTGVPGWRGRWKTAERVGTKPVPFLLDLYWEQMQGLGYKYCGRDDVFGVTEPAKNRRLYHLAFFSRNRLGSELFRKAKRHASAQQDLFF